MYVTRPLSLYRRSPAALSQPPPEGPYSGILVLQDEEVDVSPCCFGLCKGPNKIGDLPFPQNKKLELRYISGFEDTKAIHFIDAVFIPVINQPLSSCQYYVIKPHGMHKGRVYMSSDGTDTDTCCFVNTIRDLDPQPFEPNNIYQQFEISVSKFNLNLGRSFTAQSVSPGGIPPKFLRKKGWQVSTSTSLDFDMGEAPGINANLRARLPEFNFPISSNHSDPVVVGRWYCPSMFIKEVPIKTRMSRSMYFDMTLEQRWELIFESQNDSGAANSVNVDVTVQKEAVFIDGRENLQHERNVGEGMTWFGGNGLGLSNAIIERMKWEQESVGWVGEKGEENVKRVEDYGGKGIWRKFGMYMLVERFVLKRMDGSVVLTYDFVHTHQLRSKWE